MLGALVDVKAVLSAALEVAMGMAYLHGRDLIHGNLNGGADLLYTAPFRSAIAGAALLDRMRGVAW